MSQKNTFTYLLERNARSIPDKPAVIYGEKKYTWYEYNKRSNSLANAFLDLGVKRMDRVAIGLYNGNQFTEAMFAAFKIAAVPININYRYYEKELHYVIDHSDSTVFLLNEDLIDRTNKIRPDLTKVKHYIVTGEHAPNDMINYDELIKNYPCSDPKLHWAPMNDEDIGYQMYTGGTTGYPKGTLFTQKTGVKSGIEAISSNMSSILPKIANAPESTFQALRTTLPIPGISGLLSNSIVRFALERRTTAEVAKGIIRRLPPSFTGLLPRLLGGNLRMLYTTPFIHAYTWHIGLLTLSFGVTMVILPGKSFDPNEAWETVERDKIAILGVVGDATCKPMAEALDSKDYDTSSLFTVLSSGAATSANVKKRLLEHIPNLLFIDMAASSEAFDYGFGISSSSDKEIHKSLFRLSSHMKIFNEKNEPAGTGEVGEIAKSGDIMPEGYYKDPKRNKKVFKTIDGKRWFFTGDMATIDDKGNINFVGRGSECINTGGEKVFPEEVEDLIITNPKVENVGVVGIPSEKWGEAVTAVVQLKKGEDASSDEIIDFCRGKIAGYKKPIYVMFVDSIPLTTAGKAYRIKIKELANETLL